ncbi:MAG: Uma2 family endonuclease [Caldilineaceae bacterium]
MTVKIAPVLEPLLKSPKLTRYADQLQEYIQEEQQRRAAFYDWLTEDTKAEFINGEIVVQTPAKKRHTVASMNLSALLDAYVEQHQLGFVGAETVLIALTRNDYLPDICFFSHAKAQQILPDQVKYPAPDFIVEVLSPSTESTDRGVKFEEYADSGVQEYWLVDPDAQSVEQYLLHGETYELILKIKAGEISSEVVAGFTIPVAAIFDRRVKNQMLASILSQS